MSIDPAKAVLLKKFSKAFNSNDIAGTKACVTDDFKWIFYEGSNAPHGEIFHGAETACAAVVARSKKSQKQIEFSEAEEYQAGDKVFTLYRAKGSFVDSGPFDVRAIDVYSFKNDLLTSKDTYWKIIR
jgi:ketosteroid isomerase-like protein